MRRLVIKFLKVRAITGEGMKQDIGSMCHIRNVNGVHTHTESCTYRVFLLSLYLSFHFQNWQYKHSVIDENSTSYLN